MKHCKVAALFAAAACVVTFVPCALAQTFAPVTQQILENPQPSDWLMMSRTYDAQHFSPLNQINKSNVSQLRVAWSRGLPNGTQESTPIVYRGVMYLYVPGAGVMAVDATTGDQLWEYKRDYPSTVRPAAARNKSIAIFADMIYFAAPDGVLVALDARTGKVRWETKVDHGGQTAGGLIVADGKVISNRTCLPVGNEPMTRDNCFIAAHDAMTGKETWKFFTTAAPGEPGGDTWADMPVNDRIAGPWGLPGSYDPKRKVLYWGVANPDPYTRLTRHGRPDAVSLTAPANLYSNSTVALDVATGKLVWYYQELPGDDWDTDHNHERVLVRTRVSPDPKFVKWISSTFAPGSEHDVVLTVSEGGDLFAVDRENGDFLWAMPFPYDDPNLNMNDVDPKTGKTQINYEKVLKRNGDSKIICYFNTKSLWSISYHPGKNALYVPYQDQCESIGIQNYESRNKQDWAQKKGVMHPGADPNKYMNLAKIDVATGEMKVLYSQPQASVGSALATAGDLVFWGDQNRRLRAFDADDGKILWQAIVAGMVVTSTISYAVDGKQYVMVFTGEAQSATAGPLGLTRTKMPAAVRGHNSIVVFALP